MPRPPRDPRAWMPATKTHYWREVGLDAQVDPGETRRARRDAILILPLIVAVLVLYSQRSELFGNDVAVRAGRSSSWWCSAGLARAIGRAARPWLFRRLDLGPRGPSASDPARRDRPHLAGTSGWRA